MPKAHALEIDKYFLKRADAGQIKETGKDRDKGGERRECESEKKEVKRVWGGREAKRGRAKERNHCRPRQSCSRSFCVIGLKYLSVGKFQEGRRDNIT